MVHAGTIFTGDGTGQDGGHDGLHDVDERESAPHLQYNDNTVWRLPAARGDTQLRLRCTRDVVVRHPKMQYIAESSQTAQPHILQSKRFYAARSRDSGIFATNLILCLVKHTV